MAIPILIHRTPCADKNDKLKWTGGFIVREGTELLAGYRSNDRELLQELLAMTPAKAVVEVDNPPVHRLWSLWKGGTAQRRGTKNYHLLYDGWTRVRRGLEFESVRQAMLAMLRFSLLRYWDEVFLTGMLLGDRLVVGDPRQIPEMADLAPERLVEGQLHSYVLIHADGSVSDWSEFNTLTGVPGVSRRVSEVNLIASEPVSLTQGEASIRVYSNTYGRDGQTRLGYLQQLLQGVAVRGVSGNTLMEFRQAVI